MRLSLVLMYLILNVRGLNLKFPKAKLALFGVSGRTGECVLNHAMNMNKSVVSLVRSDKEIDDYDGKHTIYRGDVRVLEDVRNVYENKEISGTIICLGGLTSDVGETMLTEGTRNIIKCIKESKTSSLKIALVTSIGVGDSKDEPPYFFKMLMSTVLREAFSDKNNQEQLFLNKNGIGNKLEFVIVRPSGLTNDYMKKTVVIKSGSGTIPRVNVAEFLLNAVYDDEFPYIGKAVSITSKSNYVIGDIFESKF